MGLTRTAFLLFANALVLTFCGESQIDDQSPQRTNEHLTIGNSLVPGPSEQRLKREFAYAHDLAETIEQLDGVESARVHLSLAAESILDANAPKQSKAAIVVHSTRGGAVSEQVIRQLAVAAVAGLEPSQVSVFLTTSTTSPQRTVLIGPIEVVTSSAFKARICLGGLLVLSLGLAIGLIIAGMKIRRLRER